MGAGGLFKTQAQAGLRVIMLDIKPELVDKGIAGLKNCWAKSEKGKMTSEEKRIRSWAKSPARST
jgi:3-hydroxyacyl-CoA dehydrogenase